MLIAWVRNLANSVQRLGNRSARRKKARRQQPYRPALENFEERLVPTAMSIPTNLIGHLGGTVKVPVNVDTLYDAGAGQQGLSAADILLKYNPAVFTVSSSDVSLGNIPGAYSAGSPNGWSIPIIGTDPGEIAIELTSNGSNQYFGTNGGTLVNVNFHVKSTAPFGAAFIDLANTLYMSSGTNYLSSICDDNFSGYSDSPAPTNNSVDQETINFTGTVTGGAFSLNMPAIFGGGTTSSISYSTNAATLQSNIATVLGSSVTVSATSATSVTLTMTGYDPYGAPSSPISVNTGSLTGTSPGASVVDNGLIYVGSTDPDDGTVTIPLLYVPTNLTGTRSGTVTVPVKIETLNDPSTGQQGLSAADICLKYNTAVFTVSSSDVSLGTMPGAYSAGSPNGWSIPIIGTDPGEIAIELTSNGSNQYFGTNGGTLVNVTFHIKSGAPTGAAFVDLADSLYMSSGSNYITSICDENFGGYNLYPTPTRNSVDSENITFGGTVTGGTFTLSLPSIFGGGTTSNITYSTNLATLQSNIAAALGSSVTVVVNSASSVTLIFTGYDHYGAPASPVSATNTGLTGTSPTVSVLDNGLVYLGFDPCDGIVTIS